MSNDSSIEICQFCKKRLKEPRILPCLHTFCTACLQEFKHYVKDTNAKSKANIIVDSNSNDSASGYESEKSSLLSLSSSSSQPENKKFIVCPLCKNIVILPDLGILGFPRNHLANKINLFLEEDKKKVCDLCVDIVIAISHCTECNIYLCEFCTNAHERQKKTMSHLITMVDPAQKVIALCEMHNEEAKYFCENCQKQICNNCFFLHQNHQCESLLKTGKKYFKKLSSLKNKVDLQIKSLQMNFNTLPSLSDKLQKWNKSILEEINIFSENYISALKQHKQNLSHLANQVMIEQEKKIESYQRTLKHYLNHLNTWEHFVSLLLSCDFQYEFVELSDLAIKRLDQLSDLNPANLPLDIKEFTFSPNQPAGILNGFQLFGSIVSISIDPTKCFLKPLASADSQLRFLLLTRDANDLPFIQGGQDVKAFLTLLRNPEKRYPVAVEDRNDGSYILMATPERTTEHLLLHVLLAGEPIKGSPFSLPMPCSANKSLATDDVSTSLPPPSSTSVRLPAKKTISLPAFTSGDRHQQSNSQQKRPVSRKKEYKITL